MISVFLFCQFKLNTELCGFSGQVSRLGLGLCVACAGAMVPLTERPSLWAQRKLTRQAWVCQWQAPGGKLVWVHGHCSSCSCMTLTTATTRQVILLLLVLSEVMLPWYDACRPFSGREQRVYTLICLGGCEHACMHMCVQCCKDMFMHMCVTKSLPLWVCACVCVKTLMLHKGGEKSDPYCQRNYTPAPYCLSIG